MWTTWYYWLLPADAIRRLLDVAEPVARDDDAAVTVYRRCPLACRMDVWALERDIAAREPADMRELPRDVDVVSIDAAALGVMGWACSGRGYVFCRDGVACIVTTAPVELVDDVVLDGSAEYGTTKPLTRDDEGT